MSLSTRRAAALLTAAAAAAAGACSEGTAPDAQASALVANAFASASPGFDQHTTSYDAGSQMGTWAPERRGPAGRGGPRGGPDPVGFGAFMGGGMVDAFLGGPAGGFGRRGPFGGPFGGASFADSACTFAAGTGRVTCTPVTRGGLTFTRSVAYTTAGGAAQPAFDSLTTNTVNVQTSVSGTATFTADSLRGGRGRGRGHGFGPGFGPDSNGPALRIASATSTVQSASSRTVTGLAAGSTARTVTSASSGRERTAGTTTDNVAFTSEKTMGDTTTGLVVPVRAPGSSEPVYPTAGTVVRAMTATVTFAGQSAVTSTRREVLTYDGSATARLVITRDGATRNCTVALPRGRPSCS
jgi:hypothetical protein